MIKTAVFPVAGRGSRLHPATQATPKELLPVLDTPLLDFAVEEAREAGIERFVFVTSADKPQIAAYLGRRFADLDCRFVTQDAPRGLGHAVWVANGAVDDAPFAVILPDDLIIAAPSVLAQMVAGYDAGFVHHMVAATPARRDAVAAYGIFDAATPPEGGQVWVDGLVEKPSPDDAPSTLAAVGRYILHPTIFETLLSVGPGRGDEVQLTDAITRDRQKIGVAAFRFHGVRFDCGTPDGLLEAGSALQDARDLMRPEPVA